MKKKTIPTLIGVIFLALSLALGVGFVSYSQSFRLGASGELSPKDVRVSNISDNSFVVSWTTDKKTTGFVKYGENQNSLGKVAEESTAGENLTHLVRISGLSPGNNYFFKINSGGKDLDNNGLAWQAQTGPQIGEPVQNMIASGTVLTASGKPAANALIHITFGGALLTVATSANGSWLVPISSARTADLTAFQNINPGTTLLEINIQAGLGEIASAQIYPQSANPAPAIILGQVLDFKNLPPSSEGEIPEADLDAPEESTPSSGFNLPDDIPDNNSQVVTLESLENGEVVTSTTPEFFGSGPVNTKITIKVESDPIVEENVTVPSSGEWKWTPPKNLSEGTHKITISWKDTAGIIRSLTRTFVVQASEGPAFEATPSGTLATPTASPVATLPPQPESGSLTPTLILFMMGTGAMMFAFLLLKKIHA